MKNKHFHKAKAKPKIRPAVNVQYATRMPGSNGITPAILGRAWGGYYTGVQLGMDERLQEESDKHREQAAETMTPYYYGCAIMALREAFHFGPERIARFMAAMNDKLNEHQDTPPDEVMQKAVDGLRGFELEID